MKKQKIKTGLYVFYCFWMIVISMTGWIIYNLANWVLDTWGLLSIDEIIFHLKVPLEGTNSDVVIDGINACLPMAILVLLFCFFLVIGLKRKRKAATVSLLLVAVLSVGSASKAVYRVYDDLDVKGYLESQKEDSHFIEKNYVDPRTVSIDFPEQKRNLIYIFMESMESTYASKDVGGAMDFNCIPELTQLAEENTNFSNSDKLGGGQAASGTSWTMGAIFGQTSGLPIKNGNNETLAAQSSFSSQSENLEDILADEGYNQCFMIGSDATFGGRRAYFESHGECEIWDYNTAVETGKIPSDYHVWWGYEDEKLFSYAKEKLTEMSQQNEPFNFTMLTADTHFEDGYVCDLCGNEFGDNQYANVMACSSRQIDAFVKWIQEQPFYENTTIILTGDHLTMDSDFCENVSDDYERSVYNTFINLPEGLDTSFEKTHNREFATLDMFPTTLAALGVQVQGDKLALGTNLFSDQATLTEQYGRDGLNVELQKKSSFYDMLIDDVDMDAGKTTEEPETNEEENQEQQPEENPGAEMPEEVQQQIQERSKDPDVISGKKTYWNSESNYNYNNNNSSSNGWDNSNNGSDTVDPEPEPTPEPEPDPTPTPEPEPDPTPTPEPDPTPTPDPEPDPTPTPDPGDNSGGTGENTEGIN